MSDPWTLIGYIIVALIAIVLLSFIYGLIKAIVSQWLTDLKRKRAHAGKLKCEGGEWIRLYGDERNRQNVDKKFIKCPLIATRVTPRGYFCEEHWEENSRRYGTWLVSYGHKLNHTMKEKRA